MYAFRHQHNGIEDKEPEAGPDFFNDINKTYMDNIQIVQDVYKNFGERNVPGVLAHFDKNVVWMRPEHLRYLFAERIKVMKG
jgi:Ketosteroid isomerase-related protein